MNNLLEKFDMNKLSAEIIESINSFSDRDDCLMKKGMNHLKEFNNDIEKIVDLQVDEKVNNTLTSALIHIKSIVNQSTVCTQYNTLKNEVKVKDNELKIKNELINSIKNEIHFRDADEKLIDSIVTMKKKDNLLDDIKAKIRINDDKELLPEIEDMAEKDKLIKEIRSKLELSDNINLVDKIGELKRKEDELKRQENTNTLGIIATIVGLLGGGYITLSETNIVNINNGWLTLVAVLCILAGLGTNSSIDLPSIFSKK